MLVQLGLCWTCSETTLLVFQRGGSNIKRIRVSSRGWLLLYCRVTPWTIYRDKRVIREYEGPNGAKVFLLGVKGKPLRWIESFLVERRQTLILNGNSSDKLQVSSGVLKGSVLVPFSFCFILTTFMAACSLKFVCLPTVLQCMGMI